MIICCWGTDSHPAVHGRNDLKTIVLFQFSFILMLVFVVELATAVSAFVYRTKVI